MQTAQSSWSTLSQYNNYQYNFTSGECALYYTAKEEKYLPCDNGKQTLHGYSFPADEFCNCTRTMQSIGKEDIEIVFGDSISNDPAGGFWQSFPAGGECQPGQVIGDKGCAWRLNNISRAINASCMYETFDNAIEQLDPTCFAKCDQPHNVTSRCYLSCYNTAVGSAT